MAGEVEIIPANLWTSDVDRLDVPVLRAFFKCNGFSESNIAMSPASIGSEVGNNSAKSLSTQAPSAALSTQTSPLSTEIATLPSPEPEASIKIAGTVLPEVLTEKTASGVSVPIPVFPFPKIIKLDVLSVSIYKAGVVLAAVIAKTAPGVVLAMPTFSLNTPPSPSLSA